jgi:glycosyltransferase involved in cell wall biosynthesis
MKFSLIICSYNPNKEWLEQAIKSCQGLFDEYILVDDGSDEPILCPEKFTLLRQAHSGLYVARNLGVSEAMGDVICFLDDDDEFLNKVQEMKDFVKKNYDKADIFTHDYIAFGELKDQLIKMGHNPDNILDINQYVGTSWFKKNVWTDIGGYKSPIVEDWDFWARAIKKGKTVIASPVVFYHYRLRPGSWSYEMNDFKSEKFLKAREDVIRRYYES